MNRGGTGNSEDYTKGIVSQSLMLLYFTALLTKKRLGQVTISVLGSSPQNLKSEKMEVLQKPFEKRL